MSEQELMAQVADPEVADQDVIETEAVEAEADETPEAKEERQRETWQERRKREKVQRQRLRDELEATKAKLAEAEARAAKADSAPAVKPKESDFADYADYLAAVVQFTSKQEVAKTTKEAATAEADAAKLEASRLEAADAEMLWNHWQAQADDAKARYADFDAVVTKPGLFPRGLPQVAMIQASDVAADLAYHIASDQGLHDKLMKMRPLDAARELGRLEATIALPKPRTATSAPAPISPVRGKGGASRDLASMSAPEFAAYRAAGGKV